MRAALLLLLASNASASDVAPSRTWAERDRRVALSQRAAAGPASFELDADTVFLVDGARVTLEAFAKMEGLEIFRLEVNGGRAVKVEARTKK